jgi:hypothetical protein
MRTFIVILILAAFVQSSFVSLNLVLVLLIARSFIIDDTANYWLAFISGISLGILTSLNIGFWSLYFLIVVKLIYLVRKMPLTNNVFAIVPVTFIFCLLAAFLEQIFLSQTINFIKVVAEGLISLPIYIAIKYWEERFVVKETRLKLRS